MYLIEEHIVTLLYFALSTFLSLHFIFNNTVFISSSWEMKKL